MNTQKITRTNVTAKLNEVVNTTKISIQNANNYALNTTEEVVLETLTIATQWQTVADKALKGGVKLLDNQQNLVFDALEAYKNHFITGKKKISKIFA